MTIKEKLKNSFAYSKLYIPLRMRINVISTSLSWIWIKFFCWFPSKHFRTFCLNCHKGVHIDKSVPIYDGFEWWKGELTIGKGSSIGFHNHLDCRRGIIIGNDVCLATGVMIWTLHHDYNDVHFRVKGGQVHIGDYAWLCSRCTILPGVRIGEGAIVASGAIVCKDVEPWTVVGGVPAKIIGHREKKAYDYHPGEYWIPMA